MNWNKLASVEDMQQLIKDSAERPVLIFKHSTRCSISATALSRLERKWNVDEDKIKPYFLDLISYREISNAIADKFDVMHQSPQALIIKDGKSIYDASHFDIDYNKLLAQLS